MHRQRGSLLMDGIIALVVLGLIAGALVWAKHFVYVTWEEPAEKRGAANQFAADAPVLAGVIKERDNAREDTRQALEAAKIQSDAIERRKAAADRAIAAAVASKAEAQRKAAEAQPQLADLRAKAAAKDTKLLAVQEELDVTAEALRDALRERRQLRAPSAPVKK